MEVHPVVTGPDETIDVTWEIPASLVSPDALSGLTRHRQQGADGDAPNHFTQDWIGLFRARQRIDIVEGSILTREAVGRMQLDPRTGMARGRLRLRTPRGVGKYDFRYFRKIDHGIEPPKIQLPLARSNPVTVEVQGYSLLEAIQFSEKNLKDKSRLTSACQQLGELLRQVKTLRRPMGGPYRNEDEQENKLCDALWKLVHQCIERGMKLDEQTATYIATTETGALKQAREELDRAAQLVAAVLQSDVRDVQQPTTTTTTTEEDVPVLSGDPVLALLSSVGKDEDLPSEVMETKTTYLAKKELWIGLQKELARAKHDRASVGGGVRCVVEELQKNLYLSRLMYAQDNTRYDFIESFLRRFCFPDERFFPNEEALMEHFHTTYQFAARWNDGTKGYSVNVDARWFHDLSEAASNLIPSLVPDANFYDERRSVIAKLQFYLEQDGFMKLHGLANLVPFGSSANSFGGKSSDLDLCLVLQTPLSAEDAPVAVEMIANILRMRGYVDVDDVRKTARIPVVKFKDPAAGNLECDICVNNQLAIRNTLMLRAYGSISERARTAILIIKAWAKARDVNNPSFHTISSYGWILLAINYLQRVGLLPVLQDLPPEPGMELPSLPSRGPDGRLYETYFFGDPESPYFATPEQRERAMDKLRSVSNKAEGSVGSLLAGFFWDLAFATDWRAYVASVRAGTLMSKPVKAVEDSWRLNPRCAIEDPFETSYDVAHVLRDGTFDKIKKEAVRAYALLTKTHSELSAIIAHRPMAVMECLLTADGADAGTTGNVA